MDRPCEDDEEELIDPYYQHFSSVPPTAAEQARRPDDRNKEPLRVGDVVKYTHPQFVAGQKQGLRITRVTSIDPEREDFPVFFTNGEFIPVDTRIQRVKEYVRGALLPHDGGVFREIQHFRLMKGELNAGNDEDDNVCELAGFKRVAKRFKAVIDQGRKEFQQNVRTVYQLKNQDHQDGASSSSSDEDGDSHSENRETNRKRRWRAKTPNVDVPLVDLTACDSSSNSD